MRVSFRSPSPADLDALAANMRPMDVKECELIADAAPREALRQCVDGALWSVVAKVGDEPVCIFGLTDADAFLRAEGFPWMLCANGIERHGRAVLALAPKFIADMQAECERLHNVVHADNRVAIRFIRWCGFELGERFTVKGETFIRFEWERKALEAEAA